ncbi:protein MALE DISCOVERER 2-like [Hevea brasiliensis]|uniref:protein MALE DISCOVERER 2-like n=1 Tax=Hevea brasiliensis TaxID=3981 RepID=UPI0025F07FF6|nr:protein MALE DISCOVERER 2-like [Hevea brasiliensis]
MLSRINHRNFVNLIGYCEEDEPFNRMMIIEISFLPQDSSKSKSSGDNESAHSTLPPLADVETNVYCFGILLLEIIYRKLQYSEEQRISYLIDPTLKSFKNNECIQLDPRQRPTMKDITSKLREVIAISLDQATPRLSPLWWAELEILFVEAT